MRLYESEKDELLLLYWFLALRNDPLEFENLFAEPLRNLTAIMAWAQNAVRVMIDVDDDGIRFAAWITPYLSGAELGAWSRKSYRGTKAHLKFMDEVYEIALSQFPVLIGLTKQERLHRLHLRMGYIYVGEVPMLFDGKPVREYYMTKETRDERFNQQDLDRKYKQSLRAVAGEIQPSVPAGGATIRRTRKRSTPHRGRERTDTGGESGGGRIEAGGVTEQPADAGSIEQSGT